MLIGFQTQFFEMLFPKKARKRKLDIPKIDILIHKYSIKMFGPREIFHYLRKGEEEFHAYVKIDVGVAVIVISNLEDTDFTDCFAASGFRISENENLLETIFNKIDEIFPNEGSERGIDLPIR